MTNETIFIIKLISLILSKREFIILIYNYKKLSNNNHKVIDKLYEII